MPATPSPCDRRAIAMGSPRRRSTQARNRPPASAVASSRRRASARAGSAPNTRRSSSSWSAVVRGWTASKRRRGVEMGHHGRVGDPLRRLRADAPPAQRAQRSIESGRSIQAVRDDERGPRALRAHPLGDLVERRLPVPGRPARQRRVVHDRTTPGQAHPQHAQLRVLRDARPGVHGQADEVALDARQLIDGDGRDRRRRCDAVSLGVAGLARLVVDVLGRRARSRVVRASDGAGRAQLAHDADATRIPCPGAVPAATPPRDAPRCPRRAPGHPAASRCGRGDS